MVPIFSFSIKAACLRQPFDEIVRRYEGKGYADLKADLGEVVVERPRAYSSATSASSRRTRATRWGCSRPAPKAAWPMLAKVRERVGLVPRP